MGEITCLNKFFSIKLWQKESQNGSRNIYENNGLCAYGY